MTARWAVRAAELTAVFSPQRKYKTVRFKSHLRNQKPSRTMFGKVLLFHFSLFTFH